MSLGIGVLLLLVGIETAVLAIYYWWFGGKDMPGVCWIMVGWWLFCDAVWVALAAWGGIL